jgi:hypothetical protein
MDVQFTPRRRSLPRRSAGLPARQAARPHCQQGQGGPAPEQGRPGRMARHPQRPGLAGQPLAPGPRRPRLGRGGKVHFRHRVRAGRWPAHRALWREHAGPGAHQIRQRAAKGVLAAAHPERRRLVVPGLLRTRRGVRPGLGQNHRGARSPTPRATTTSSTARRPGPPRASTPT